MKMIDDVIIIGIDSGYGNIKTANCCFPASVSAYDKEPVFKENLLVYESKFYLIGEGHKEFLADKTRDLDYYVLALAAIARELNIRKMTCGKIRIAAGLPLTWVSGQRDEFRDYLLQNKAVDFSFRNVSYHVEIVGVDVFPQGFAAVADRLSDFRGVNMICDIGNGTMNIMFINDKKPVSGNMFTEKYGTHQCLLAVRENVMRAHHTTVDEAIINRVFRFGTADIKEEYLKTITDTATDYVEGIFQRLREHEYNPELMRLYVLGGGSCLIRNFGVYDASRVTINDDICATAKGYEYLAYVNLLKKRGYRMSSKRLSLRFNLNNPGDLAAWEYLHRLDGDSINKEIISMINASKQNNDLRELLRQTITVAMQGMALQPVEKKAEISENDLAALDFINSL